MYDISMICKIASVLVFIEGSNDKVSIPEIASFGQGILLSEEDVSQY